MLDENMVDEKVIQEKVIVPVLEPEVQDALKNSEYYTMHLCTAPEVETTYIGYVAQFMKKGYIYFPECKGGSALITHCMIKNRKSEVIQTGNVNPVLEIKEGVSPCLTWGS